MFVQKLKNGELVTEGIWCIEHEDGCFIIDNIPFIARNIACGDKIKIEFSEEDNNNYFDSIVSASGNSTIRVYFDSTENIESTREILNGMKCESEVFLSKMIIAVNIPKDTNYIPIKKFLDEGEDKGKWEYEESCLSHNPANGLSSLS